MFEKLNNLVLAIASVGFDAESNNREGARIIKDDKAP